MNQVKSFRNVFLSAMRVMAAMLASVVLLLVSGCGAGEKPTGSGVTSGATSRSSKTQNQTGPDVSNGGSAADDTRNDNAGATESEQDVSVITITVNEQSFTATLADTETARAFSERLPMTLSMDEMNGNEKYHFLDESLPSNASNPGTIHAGDLMLYGSDCVVLFYKTFQTSYSYTRIGSVDNPDGLAEAVGSGGVSVVFSE